MDNIAVIGCGVVGLTSALAIQKRLKDVSITIFTKELSPNTTGDLAAGLWEPYLVEDTPEEKVMQWSKATFDYILKLWKDGRAKDAGIVLQPIINLSDKKDDKVPDWVNITLGHSKLSRDRLADLSRRYNKHFTEGYLFVAFTWEASRFLPFLQQEFLRNGGKIEIREIKEFDELAKYDVIVNCTGLQSRKLTNDTRLHPVRGQIARVDAPWQYHTYIVGTDKLCYIIPNIDCVILGGTKQPSYSTEIDETDKREIISKCSELLPAMKAAKVIEHQVGLRPGRDRVRLEIEIKGGDKSGVRIVHNYGHGGAGITLCVGCAAEAAELVEQVLNQRDLKGKL